MEKYYQQCKHTGYNFDRLVYMNSENINEFHLFVYQMAMNDTDITIIMEAVKELMNHSNRNRHRLAQEIIHISHKHRVQDPLFKWLASINKERYYGQNMIVIN